MFHLKALSFDQYTFNPNVSYALNLISTKDGKVLLNRYNEAKIETRLQERDIITTFEITKNEIKNTSPITGTIEGIQSQRIGTKKISRFYRAEFKVKELSGKSNKNKYGAILYDYSLKENRLIK